MIYPFLIVLPFATSYIDDYNNQLLPIYVSRSSRESYYLSKLIVSFLGTAVTFALPLLFNLLLCNACFPHNRHTTVGTYPMNDYIADLLGENLLYHSAYPETPFLKLYLSHPFLYNLMYIAFLSLFFGLVAMLIMGISFVCKKNKLVLFVPTFAVVQVLTAIQYFNLFNATRSGGTYINFNVFHYVIPSRGLGNGRSPILMLAVIIGIVIGTMILYQRAVRDKTGVIQ